MPLPPPSQILVDVQEGTTARKTSLGWEYTRIAIVSNLSGVGYSRLRAAVDGVISDVGDIGSPHPDSELADAKIVEFNPEAMTPQDVRVEIVYRTTGISLPLDQVLIEVGSAVSQQQTNLDKDGNKVTVSYLYPDDYATNETRRGKTLEQGGTWSKLVPETHLIFTRNESTDPAEKSLAYVGKTNDGPWYHDGDALVGQWMVFAITGRSQDSGLTYEVVYQLGFRKDGWNETVVFINPDDGKPPGDLVADEGYTTPENYDHVDLDGLELWN